MLLELIWSNDRCVGLMLYSNWVYSNFVGSRLVEAVVDNVAYGSAVMFTPVDLLSSIRIGVISNFIEP